MPWTYPEPPATRQESGSFNWSVAAAPLTDEIHHCYTKCKASLYSVKGRQLSEQSLQLLV